MFNNELLVSEWQEDCIIKGGTGSNLLISMPTSGGKTLVAEVLLWQQLLLKNHDALFILPCVALVQEKASGIPSLPMCNIISDLMLNVGHDFIVSSKILET